MSNDQKKDKTFIPMPDLSGKKGFQKPGNTPKTADKGFTPSQTPQTEDPASNPIQKALYKDFQTSPTIIRLPQPFFLENKLVTTVEIQEITGAIEEEYNTPSNKENLARFITAVLTSCVTHFNTDIIKSDYKIKEWRQFILLMPMSDREFILYAIYALCKNSKEIILPDAKCPSCSSKGFVASLDEMELQYYTDIVEDYVFELTRGYTFEKILYKTVLAGTPDGIAQEKVFPLYQTGGAKAETMLYAMCVKKIQNIESNRAITFNIDIARALSKIDRDVLNNEIGVRLPGIRNFVGLECECGEKFLSFVSIYDFFLK